jgi:hypothetical protein
MTREEWLVNPAPYAARGFDLPQTKLPEGAIRAIREAAEKREQLRAEITEKYSNAALARMWNVHPRTIEKVLSYQTGRWVK